MKFRAIFFIALFSSVENFVSKSERSSAALRVATRNIIADLAASYGKVEILKDNKERIAVDGLVLSDLKNTPGQLVPFLIRSIYKKTSLYTLPDSAFLIFGSTKSMENFYNVTFFHTPELPREEYRYFIHCSNATFKDFASLKVTSLMEFHYFVVEENTHIRLLTFVWYTKRACHKPQLIEVNNFSKTSMKWKTESFKVEKFRNLYGCRLGVFDPNINAKFTNYHAKLNIKILRGLQKHLNFQIKFISSRKSKFIDLLLTTRAINKNRGSFNMHPATRPYFFEEVRVAIPIGEKYDGYEKFLLPFDIYVWGLMIFTFIIAFVTILVLRFIPLTQRNFIIGRFVATPALNVIMIFFGISQIALPGRNFARFLVMTFIIYSLIIRTAWQGKNFEFLQKEMRKPEVQSFEEMLEKNFTFYYSDFESEVGRTLYYKISEIKPSSLGLTGHQNLKRIHSEDEFYFKYHSKLNDPSFKGAIQVIPEWLHHFATSSNGTFLKRIFKERLSFEHIGWDFSVTTTKTLMFTTIDEKLQQLLKGGIINHYNSEFTESLKVKRYEHLHQQGPEVLTMEHLEASFVIWLVSISAASFVFVFEWIIVLRDFIICRWILKSYFEEKHVDLRRCFMGRRFIQCES